MLVRIDKVLARTPAGSLVRFSSAFGSGAAGWSGPVPAVGESYHVEIEVPGVVEWGRDIVVAERPEASVREEAGELELVGRLEWAIPDGASTIRIGEGLLLLDTHGEPCEAGTYVKVHTRGAILHDERI